MVEENAPTCTFHGRTTSSNIIKFRQGVIGKSLNTNSPVDFWEDFTTPDMINLLVKYTNIVIATKKESYSEPCRVKDTGIIEIKALIGLLMLAGAYHSNRLNLADAWGANDIGKEVFRLLSHWIDYVFCCVALVSTKNQHRMKERKKISLPCSGKYLSCLYKIAKITISHRNI